MFEDCTNLKTKKEWKDNYACGWRLSFGLYALVLVLCLRVDQHDDFLQRSVRPVVREVVEVAVIVLNTRLAFAHVASSYLKF